MAAPHFQWILYTPAQVRPYRFQPPLALRSAQLIYPLQRVGVILGA